jgi:hypothetical protein
LSVIGRIPRASNLVAIRGVISPAAKYIYFQGEHHGEHRPGQLLLATYARPNLDELKRQVRGWHSNGSPGQDAINRAMVRALDELHARIDALTRI